MKSGWILISVFLALSGCGYGVTNAEQATSTANHSLSSTIHSVALSPDLELLDFTNDNYRVLQSFSMRAQRRLSDPTEEDISFSEGDEILILERTFVPGKGNYLRLGLERVQNLTGENEGLDFVDIWIQERELPLSSLEQFFPTEEEELAEDGSWEQVRRRMTYCFRYVKKYLLSTGQVKTYLPGASAYQAYWILPKHGFVKTTSSPTSASNGEVCVYSGGPQGHGHIEVKRDGKWWYGYGFKDQPISKRKFMGCFKKA